MSTQESGRGRHRSLRLLKGPLWMADLLDIFGCTTISELRNKIGRYAHGVTFFDESKLYHRYNRGEILPGKAEIDVWLSLCDQADRVARLPVWEVVGENNLEWLSSKAFMTLYERLSPEAKKLIARNTNKNSRGIHDVLILPKHSVLIPLVRMCSIDALTVLLLFINRAGRAPLFDGYVARLIPYAIEAFLRLSVFPPFQAVRNQFFCHINNDFFQRMHDDLPMIEPLCEEDMMRLIDERIRSLKIMGRLGLVGGTLKDQVKFVHWYCDKVDAEVAEAIRRLDTVPKPAAIQPTDPLYRALRRMRHPATRSARAIELPWKGRYVLEFRIANALGEPVVRWNLLASQRT